MEEHGKARVKWPKLDGREMLQHLLGGSRNLGAMILRGERSLTLPHIRKLAAHFEVGPELFI